MRSEVAILHLDGDDFFASLARMKKPGLKGRPVVVGNLESRGYVVAASYEARAAGVHSGLTMTQAGIVCPDAALIQVDWELAQRASRALMNLAGRYSPVIERTALDAMFIDYSGSEMLFGPAADFGHRLQKEIRDNLRLSVSAGLSADKAVSAVACRAAKLGKLQNIRIGEERMFMRWCPVEWLPGVTPGLTEYFRVLGVRYIGELAEISTEVLSHVLGDLGEALSRRAKIMEHASVVARRAPDEPEVREEFASDVLDRDVMISCLADLASRLGRDLRRRFRSARRLVVKVAYADQVIEQMQGFMDPPSNRDPEILSLARKLFTAVYTRRVRVKSLLLRARHLKCCPSELPFEDAARRVKWNRVLAAVDKARERFGGRREVIGLGSSIEKDPKSWRTLFI